jgi:hypothetical protein
VTSAQLNLGPLQVNPPGSTATHALLAGSAAVDAVTDCADLDGNTVAQDQRGVTRPQGPSAMQVPSSLMASGSICLWCCGCSERRLFKKLQVGFPCAVLILLS